MKRSSLLLGLFVSTALASAQGPIGPPAPVVDPNAVAPGELLVEPPTLINLGFEWFVEGDENRNATVTLTQGPATSTSPTTGSMAATIQST